MNRLLISLCAALLAMSMGGCKGIKVDKELMDLINAAAAKCKIDMRYAFVSDCAEAGKLSELTIKKMPEAIATVSAALNDKNDKVRVVACQLMYREVKDNISKVKAKPEVLTDAVIDGLINGTGGIKSYVAMYAAASTVYAASIKGKTSELYKMLQEHPESAVRTEGYSKLMAYGRLKTFDKVKDLAKSSDKSIVYAALNAPRDMYDVTEDENRAICDWALPFLSNDDTQVSYQAAAILNRYKGKYIDAVLDMAEKLAKDGKLTSPFSLALTNFTFSCKPFMGTPPNGTKDQCDRKEKLIKLIKK